MPPLNHLSRTALTLALSQAITLPAQAATIVVNTSNDAPIGQTTGQATTCSLRAAIESANTNAPVGGCISGNQADTIDLTGINGTITLSEGELDITSAITVNGPGRSTLAISGDNSSRIFVVTQAGDLTIDALTLSDGSALDSGGAISNSGTISITNSALSSNSASIEGGSIFSTGESASTTITNSTLSSNSAIKYGGAISFDGGTNTITNSTLSGNSTEQSGGAIYSNGSSTITTITGTTLSGNSVRFTTYSDRSASPEGGAIRASRGTITITNSTLSDNSVDGIGGAISSRASTTITNSTLSGNSAIYSGGAIITTNSDETSISNCTLSGNLAGTRGGAIYISVSDNTSISNSTLSGNSSGRNGGGVYISRSRNTTISNSTLSGNSAENRGGGIYNRYSRYSTITSNIIAGNLSGSGSGSEIYERASFAAQYSLSSNNVLGSSAVSDLDAFNVILDDTNLIATRDQLNVPLRNLIAPLADNGGPTLTHGVRINSIALGASNNCPATDQRGETRSPTDCNIGSFEGFVAAAPPEPEPDPETFFVVPLPSGKAVIFGL